MAMPGWAVGLGALMKAPEVTNDWVGLYNNINSLRDDSNASEAMQQLSKFRTSGDLAGFQPDGYMRPATRSTLEKLRQDKLDLLRAQESAPTQAEAARLNRIAANDPYVGGEEGRQDFAERPEFWLGAKDTGIVPGAKKGDPALSVDGANPHVAATVQQFGAGNQNILDTFRAGSGDRMALARVMQNKDLSNNFKDATAGVENLDKVDRNTRTATANNDLNKFISSYDLQPTTESWNGLVNGIRNIPGISPELVTSTLKDMAGRNNAPRGTLQQFVKNGPNSTRSEVRTDMFGEPVANTHVVSSNNPSDRELGLMPAKDSGESGMVSVAWVGADGTAQQDRIPRGDLPALKAKLQAQGVKEIDTVDGKRASKRETLIKPTKKRGLGLQAPAGATAPASKGGGYKFVNGQLVPN